MDGVSPLLLGLTPCFCWMSGGYCPPCQIQLWLFPRKARLGLGPWARGASGQEAFLGALYITNGVGTSCGWRKRGWGQAWLCSQSPAASLSWSSPGSMSHEGYRAAVCFGWSMKAELVSRFSLSDSKGSLEPHKPGKCPAEIAALTPERV